MSLLKLNENYIGIAAGVFTSISLIPQFLKVIREKKSEDISLWTLFVLLAGLLLWVYYGIVKSDWPLIVTNSFSVLVNLLVIIFTLRYKK